MHRKIKYNEEIYRHAPKGVITRRSTDWYVVRNHWSQMPYTDTE